MNNKNKDKPKPYIVYLYMIRDIKARRYFSPFKAENDDVAMRFFSQQVSTGNTIFSNNPSDFELFNIGDFDESDGQIDILDQYEHVCNGLDAFSPEDKKNT